ncbi:TNT domain-containing protein [Bounagaea algeriensis]
MSDRAPRGEETDASDTGPIAAPEGSSAADTGPIPLAAPGRESRTAPGRALPPADPRAGPGSQVGVPRGAEQVRPRAALRPAAPGIPPVSQRPARAARTPRSAEATAFVLHQFPLGYMPVSASTPVHQRAGEGIEQQRELRAAYSAQQPADPTGPEAAGILGPATALPAELLTGYEPDGGFDPREWDCNYRDDTGEGGYVWPPSGSPGSVEPLPAGAEVDLLGTPARRVVFAAGTPFAERAQPPEYRRRPYRRFRVRRAVPVVRDEAQAWFGQPGGGTRYVLPCSVVELAASGSLVEDTAGAAGGADAGVGVAGRAAELPGGSGDSERTDTRVRAVGGSDPLDAPNESTGVRFGSEGESASQEAR